MEWDSFIIMTKKWFILSMKLLKVRLEWEIF
jgi:hypothetical protein